MKGYAPKDVAKLLDLSPTQVRAFARSGFLQPGRASRGGFRFSFPDLVLLRAAKGLAEARIPLARITRALRKLQTAAKKWLEGESVPNCVERDASKAL